MKLFKFYKTEQARWYIDLPEFLQQGLGTQDDLELVAGADFFLDILSQGEESVNITLSATPFEGAERLTLVSWNPDCIEEGAYYLLSTYQGKEYGLEMWLCWVTTYVFNGGYPPVIYFKK